MANFICTTCGVQHAETAEPPRVCPICEDERQFVGWEGQGWTTLAELQRSRKNVLKPEGHGLTGIASTPKFGIGQRALLVRTSEGNLLWDCISLVDDATVQEIMTLGGLAGIAISHPHYYSCMVEWSRRFGGAPVYLHADDRQWALRRSPEIVFWEGETRTLFGGITLIRSGGHFDGGAVLHWGEGEHGRGALLSGDIIQVVADRRYVSFMRSYPNYVPLPPSAVTRIVQSVAPFEFEKIYGAFWDAIVAGDGKMAVQRSAERYLTAIEG